MSEEEKLLMAVWMAFWAYFEYKIGNAYLWRKNGKEQISFDQNNIEYKRIIGKKITAKSFVIDNISDITIYEFGKNNFSDSFQNSYWVIEEMKLFLLPILTSNPDLVYNSQKRMQPVYFKQ